MRQNGAFLERKCAPHTSLPVDPSIADTPDRIDSTVSVFFLCFMEEGEAHSHVGVFVKMKAGVHLGSVILVFVP